MGCHCVLTGHVPTRQSRLRPTLKGSKITEPPRICTDPANYEPAGTIPGRTGQPQTGHSAHCSNCETRGRSGRPAKPAHTALDATVADVRTAFGRAATTASIFTYPGNKAPSHYGESTVRVSSRLNAMY
jgi:hypothetical protein